jgi:Uma2 family endonuclease
MAQTEVQLATLPLLENGDHLTRPEFERRYEAMPQLKKAELIEGVVYMPSPVRTPQHATPHAMIVTWLGNYVAATPGVSFADNATVRLDMDNEPQPDALLRIVKGGSSRIGQDGYVEGPPELIVEVAASSVSIDLHEKLRAYRRNAVQEYVVWLTEEREIRWHVLSEGLYRPLQPEAAGMRKSELFAGLWLDARALLGQDLAAVLRCLQRGLASAEHAAFLTRLASA